MAPNQEDRLGTRPFKRLQASTQQPHGDKELQLTNYNESNYRIFYLCFCGFELFYCILVHLFHHNFLLVFVTGSIFSLLFFLEFILIFFIYFLSKERYSLPLRRR